MWAVPQIILLPLDPQSQFRIHILFSGDNLNSVFHLLGWKFCDSFLTLPATGGRGLENGPHLTLF